MWIEEMENVESWLDEGSFGPGLEGASVLEELRGTSRLSEDHSCTSINSNNHNNSGTTTRRQHQCQHVGDGGVEGPPSP
eukprot:SAG31_NODE_10056_length_1190_cov_1.530706_1_plen_78_part_10